MHSPQMLLLFVCDYFIGVYISSFIAYFFINCTFLHISLFYCIFLYLLHISNLLHISWLIAYFFICYTGLYFLCQMVLFYVCSVSVLLILNGNYNEIFKLPIIKGWSF